MEIHSKFKNRFRSLPPKTETTLAEYIWIGGTGMDIRTKTMCIDYHCSKLEDFPIWSSDGSSAHQATVSESDIILKPVFFCPDPFRYVESSTHESHNFLVLCDVLTTELEPAKANFRHFIQKISEETKDEKPWVGFEQEYILIQHEGSERTKPLAFPHGGYPDLPQGQYHCSVGSSLAFGRYVAEAHLFCCRYAGLKVCGINAEAFPSQWEFQLGPIDILEGSDQLWMARYILERVCEEFDVDVSYDPKPFKGQWFGSGCHVNFSYESTRKEGGYAQIIEAMDSLGKNHKEFLEICGGGTEDRLTGTLGTSNMEEFNYGIGSRDKSARIHKNTFKEGKGYFEDRRPSGNCNPYLVTSMIADLTILKGKYSKDIVEEYKKTVGISNGKSSKR